MGLTWDKVEIAAGYEISLKRRAETACSARSLEQEEDKKI